MSAFYSAKNYIFFSRDSEKMVFSKSCTGIRYLYYQERYFFFPKIWSYSLDGKWKIIILKKTHGNMIFSANVLERWFFQKILSWNTIFLVLSTKMIFFILKTWSYSLDGKWKHIPPPKKYIEIWYFLYNL